MVVDLFIFSRPDTLERYMQEEDFAELSDERFRDGVSPRSHFAAMCGGAGGCQN